MIWSFIVPHYGQSRSLDQPHVAAAATKNDPSHPGILRRPIRPQQLLELKNLSRGLRRFVTSTGDWRGMAHRVTYLCVDGGPYGGCRREFSSQCRMCRRGRDRTRPFCLYDWPCTEAGKGIDVEPQVVITPVRVLGLAVADVI